MGETLGRRGLPADGQEPDADAPAATLARRGVASPAASSEPSARGGARRGIAPDPAPRRFWVPLAALGVLLAAALVAVFWLPGSSGPAATASRSSLPTTPASPAPSPSAVTSPLPLDDATLQVPEGWDVYADEQVQDDRRLVRLEQGETGVRVQAVTLTSVDGDLSTACSLLITELESSYTDPAQTTAFTVPVAPGGEGYSCGFRGERTSDEQPGTVTFTMLRRDADAHTLVLRASVPDTAADDTQAAAQLEALTCSAAASFDVDLTRCN